MFNFFGVSPTTTPALSRFDPDTLQVNEAHLEIVSRLDHQIRVYGLSSDCKEASIPEEILEKMRQILKTSLFGLTVSVRGSSQFTSSHADHFQRVD